MQAIINSFEKTVFEAIGRYSKTYGVEEKDVQILLSLDPENDVVYTILKNYTKVEVVDFVKGIMGKKIDFTGKSLFVGQFIQKTLLSYAETYEVTNADVSCMIIGDTENKVKMFLYVKRDCKEEINLKKLLE